MAVSGSGPGDRDDPSPRVILDSVGHAMLSSLASDLLELAQACTIHERNGDCVESLARGAWDLDAHRNAARQSAEAGKELEVEGPNGTRVLALPIHADEEVAGAIAALCDGPSAPALGNRLACSARYIGEIVRRRQAEAALALSEKRFADFMNHLPAGAFIKDHEGRLLFANRFLQDMFDWKDCMGKSTAELLPPEMAERMVADDLRAMTEGPMVLEELVHDATGAERFFDTYKFPIAAEGGSLVAGITVETTARKRAELALRTSELFLSSIIDQSPYPMWIADLNGTLLRTNQSLRNLLHLTDADIVGKYNVFQDNIVEEQNKMPIVRRAFELGEAVRFDLEWDSAKLHSIHPENTASVILDVTMFPLRDARGQMTNVVIQHVDITERKRAEEALRESERRYRSLLDNAHMLAMMLDPDGRITFCNDYFCATTGWSCEQIVGLLFAELIDNEASPGLAARVIESAAQTGRKLPAVEGAIRTRDGKSRWIQWNSALLRSATGETTGYASLGVDVTEHRILQEHYLQAQKLESVGRLAGGVAHDFNNLLTVISGYSNFMLDGMPDNNPMRPHLQEILKAAEQAAGLTAQLLAFSRKQVAQPKPLDLNSLVADSIDMFKRMAGEDVEIVMRLSARPAKVMADPGQMRQALMNLVVNARDAMPSGGQLFLETAHVELDADFAALHPEASPGPYVLLAVTDSGVGMDSETLRRLFEPFFTTKPKGEGTGLGLSIVYGIVRQSGGWVYAYSEPGRGTVIKVYLPATALDAVEDAAVSPAAHASPATGTILVVEDQPQVRGLAVKTLQSSGYRVLEADCGDAALALAKDFCDPIDLLLTDVVMPGMTGKDLAVRLTALRPGIKVLYMSGYTEDVIQHRGVLDAGVEYIGKPFTPASLVAKAEAVLGRAAPDPIE